MNSRNGLKPCLQLFFKLINLGKINLHSHLHAKSIAICLWSVLNLCVYVYTTIKYQLIESDYVCSCNHLLYKQKIDQH